MDLWKEKYELAKQYYEKNDNLLIPVRYSLTIDNKKINLGLWIMNQRQAYKNNELNEEQISLLNKIGMIWNAKLYEEKAIKEAISNNWMKNYELAKQYYETKGNLLIPQRYSFIINDKKVNLGSWISRQKRLYQNNKLNEKQIELLDKIGMIWQINITRSNNDELSYKWKRNYELAKAYYEQYGDLFMPVRYISILDGEVIKLGYWIDTQRQAYKNNRLSEKKISLLNNIGMIWSFKLEKDGIKENYITDSWKKNYELVKQYYEEHGNSLIPQKYTLVINNCKINIGFWLMNQRIAYRNNKLNEKQIELLNKIDMVWQINVLKSNDDELSYKWKKNYELAKKYYEECGNLLIPKKYELDINGDVVRLGNWINTQRKLYKENKLNEKQLNLLNDIDMVWSFKLIKDDIRKEFIPDKWMRNYELAKKYYEKHNNLLIPSNYEVIIDNVTIKLGRWLSTQRQNYSKNNLNDKQIELLNGINMIWNPIDYKKSNDYITENWMDSYQLAKSYYEEYGNLLIPARYSLNINDGEVNLGNWIVTQRQAYKNGKLDYTKIELLNKIGMVWQVKVCKDNSIKNYISDKWMRNYELAKKYYEEHGNLLVPQKYSLIKDGENINLGTWVVYQRYLYKNNKLNKNQIDLLNKIKMVWRVYDSSNNDNEKNIANKWMKNYELAKNYHQKYNNLLIPSNYCLTVNNESINLGKWITEQRNLYKNSKLNEEQINMLNSIDMIWNIKKYVNYQKYIDEIYMLYLYYKLNDEQLNDILKNKVFIYKDDNTNDISKKQSK